MSDEKDPTIEDILQQRHMNIADLESSDTNTVREILFLINPVEISRLCVTSQKFNRICTDHSFWRMKVKRDYGIEKKYGATWKETAINMYKVNMINLNKEWINGSTYAEIVKEALEQKDTFEYLKILQAEYHLGFDVDWKSIWNGKIYPNDYMIEQIEYQLERKLTNEEIETSERAFTSEFAIIYSAFFEVYGSYVIPLWRQKYLRGMFQLDEKLAPILQQFIDVYPYIMLFSSLSNVELNRIQNY
uniref:F-box-like family protein n=1 Tax=Pithovirus LCPAC401 TaxID=2506595 RepID=A0A481ZAE9_9VIRU|nr:MAG: uncharacterized protein LCPAC401_03950 [Pithovirus LCPAC401]